MHVITAQASGQPRHCDQVARVQPASYLTSVHTHTSRRSTSVPPRLSLPLLLLHPAKHRLSPSISSPLPPLPSTPQACRTALKKEAKGSKFDVVLHDGAPNVGGAWSNEAYTQAWGRGRGGHSTSLHEGRGGR